MSLRDCDACRTCRDCGLVVCFGERPSPGEPEVCDDCSLARGLAEWGAA